MNEMLNTVRQSQLRMRLASIECRLSVLHADRKPVPTDKYALVSITDIRNDTILFTTPLLLPDEGKLIYGCRIMLEGTSFSIMGGGIKRLNELSPYEYRMEYSLDEREQIRMYAAVNAMLETAATSISRAIASYMSFHSRAYRNRSLPRQSFQI